MNIRCLPQHLTSPVTIVKNGIGRPAKLLVGAVSISHDNILDCDTPLGPVLGTDLLHAVATFDALTQGASSLPLAFVLFRITGQPALLDRFFPLATILEPAAQDAFHRQVAAVGLHTGLDLRLFGEGQVDLSTAIPEDTRYIVAAHLVEMFFYCPAILARVLSKPRHIWLYTTPRAFAQDGGVAGGDYDPGKERLQLVMSRLYEGFYGESPGVAPFLHEFGHMLDWMEIGAGRSEVGLGMLPGLRRTDGSLCAPRARALFLSGKRLEATRYQRCQQGQNTVGEIPIGHPYVFQNDGEFIAGYLELFFRTPHYLAERNPGLFYAFALLFGQDTRRAWKHDFPFYVNENRKAYLPGRPRLATTSITVPDD